MFSGGMDDTGLELPIDDTIHQHSMFGGEDDYAMNDTGEVGKAGGRLSGFGAKASSKYIVAVAFAAGCPLVMNTLAVNGKVMPGIALMPTVYMLQWLFQRQFYQYFFICMPIAAGVSLAVNFWLSGHRVSAEFLPVSMGIGAAYVVCLLPLIGAIVFHYVMVFFASHVHAKYRRNVDSFCENVSDVLARKCYGEGSLPTFLYVKKERVLHSLACLFKLLVAVSMITATAVEAGLLAVMDCHNTSEAEIKAKYQQWGYHAWINYAVLCLDDTAYHFCMYLTGSFSKLKMSTTATFAQPVVMPMYWEWYFIALFFPRHIWLPIMVMWLRNIPSALARMHDTDDKFCKYLWSFDLGLHHPPPSTTPSPAIRLPLPRRPPCCSSTDLVATCRLDLDSLNHSLHRIPGLHNLCLPPDPSTRPLAQSWGSSCLPLTWGETAIIPTPSSTGSCRLASSGYGAS